MTQWQSLDHRHWQVSIVQHRRLHYYLEQDGTSSDVREESQPGPGPGPGSNPGPGLRQIDVNTHLHLRVIALQFMKEITS